MKIHTTNYQVSNLKNMGRFQVQVKGTILGLHTENYFSTTVTLYRYQRVGRGSTDFAVLHRGILCTTVPIYPVSTSNGNMVVNSNNWYIIEGQHLTLCGPNN